ncbi:hypothetical protein [Actinacidiphila sp. ITFR-21]|uniref:hypothetical protein n=1 Tax=Actinacidiphila sp. ITFR-21 TaxID=3075199 RepID=UPI00288C58BF|nr:hypothetical protein [Streptomyces sp. ITFR-21]WNI18594.1 hypothetical protein RLT57_25710 [Streptomyces sp. ITFR-21]
MTTELARATADFAYYFRSLVAALGERPGWYGVFAEREPGAVHAYEGGTEVPPWDVVRALLHDLAAVHSAAPDPVETARAQSLHRAAVVAWDAAPGAEHALRARLDAVARAHDLAVMREREAARTLDQAAATAAPATAARLANALAWARDDRERAAARLAELTARLSAVTGRQPLPPEPGQEFWARRTAGPVAQEPPDSSAGWSADGGTRSAGHGYADGFDAAPAPASGRVPDPVPDPAPLQGRPQEDHPAADPGRNGSRRPGRAPFWGSRAPETASAEEAGDWDEAPRPERGSAKPPGTPASRRARFAPAAPEPSVSTPRGARFAGAPAAPAAPAAESAVIPLPGGVGKPRGARFAGAPTGAAVPAAAPVVPVVPAGRTAAPRGARFAGAPDAVREAPPERVVDPRWAAEAQAGAARLGELRRTGESGAAYMVLCEAAEGPAERLPYLVRELERTGLAADVATLLWEVAALPPAGLADAAAALAADGRTEDCWTLLHQVAARPPADIARVAAVLQDNARAAETGELLETLTRAHTPEDAVEVARTAPELTPALLAAAERVSKSRRRDIVAALRRAALPDH